MQLHWAARNHGGEILSLFGWAHALEQSGDLPGSRQKYEAALALSQQHGERALHALGLQLAAHGNLDAALAHISRAIEVDRAIGYAHALGHDLVDLCQVHLLRGERAQGRAALQEALVWFGTTEDAEALASTRRRLDELETQAPQVPPALPPGDARRWARSHLPLSEGKVYCAFESPLGRQRQP